LWGAPVLLYGAAVSEPRTAEDLIDQPVPDLELPSSQGGTFRLRGRIGTGPLVLFFYIRNGTPG
jgi:peroxiredoxin